MSTLKQYNAIITQSQPASDHPIDGIDVIRIFHNVFGDVTFKVIDVGRFTIRLNESTFSFNTSAWITIVPNHLGSFEVRQDQYSDQEVEFQTLIDGVPTDMCLQDAYFKLEAWQ